MPSPVIIANTSAGISGKTLAVVDGVSTVSGAWVFSGIANTGLRVLDTDSSHALSIVPGSNLTQARTLTISTGDASRTLTLGGDVSLNQSLRSDSQPTFASLTITSGLTLSASADPISLTSGALGTGATNGRRVLVGRNTSGNGAAGVVSLVGKGGTAYFLWVDATGDLRIHTAAPTEDGSTVSDTAGSIVGTQS